MREHRGLVPEWAVLPELLVDRGEIGRPFARRDVADARHRSRAPRRQALRVDCVIAGANLMLGGGLGLQLDVVFAPGVADQQSVELQARLAA